MAAAQGVVHSVFGLIVPLGSISFVIWGRGGTESFDVSQAAFSLRDQGLMAMPGSPSVLCDLQKAQALIGSTGLTWELEKP